MRIVFIGAVEFSRRALEFLIDSQVDIVGVCTLPNSTLNSDHSDLSYISTVNDIPWIYSLDINSEESIQWIADKKPNVIFCLGWSYLLKSAILKLAPLGVVGYHPSALPKNRGRHPLIWALVLGLNETASTFFIMDDGADSGDIISQIKIKIKDEDDATTLYEKMTLCALGQLQNLVPLIANNTFKRVTQSDDNANRWRKRGRADGQIDWRMSAFSVHNLIRGLAKPYVGAHFIYQGCEIKVWKSELVQNSPNNIEPGKILDAIEDDIVVQCGTESIRLLKIEPSIYPKFGDYL